MKKIISLILALTMVFALAVTASAATITIDSAVDDNPDNGIYKAYKVFDATVSGTGDDQKVAYTIDSKNQFYNIIDTYTYNDKDIFTLTIVGSFSDTIYYNVEVDPSFTGEDAAKDLAAKLEDAVTTDTTPDATSTGNKIQVTDIGYYLITSSVGTALIVDTYSGDVTINTKNEFPTIEKKITRVNNNDIGPVDETSTFIGTEITFQVTITIPATAKPNSTITIYDTMANGLDATDANPFLQGHNYIKNSLSAGWGSGHKDNPNDNILGEITVTTEMIDAAKSNPNKVFTVVGTYTAKLNPNAVIGTAGNQNKAWIKYQNYTSPEDIVTVYTGEVKVYKYTGTGDNKTALPGAGFILQEATSRKYYVWNANYAKVEWTESIDNATEYTSDSTGNVPSFKGLTEGTYTLIENTVPDGYNKATDVSFKVTSKGAVTDMQGTEIANSTIEVENKSGTVLPSTGGMGTTLFYVLGSLMAVTALVVLVTNKRMRT